MAKAKTVRKRREKKNIERGTAHIRSSFNNTIVTMSDINGNALSQSSAGAAISASWLPTSLRMRLSSSRSLLHAMTLQWQRTEISQIGRAHV